MFIGLNKSLDGPEEKIEGYRAQQKHKSDTV